MKALVIDSNTRPKLGTGAQALFPWLASLACLTLALSAPPALAGDGDAYGSTRHGRTLSVDIAENPFRFSFDTNGPLLDNGLPAYGNPFITQG